MTRRAGNAGSMPRGTAAENMMMRVMLNAVQYYAKERCSEHWGATFTASLPTERE